MDTNEIIGKNQGYYTAQFNNFESGGNNISWNWFAFLFGWVWMLYRKMYREMAVCLVAFVIAGVLQGIARLPLSLAVWILCGMFGNYIYFLHVRELKNRIGLMTEEEKRKSVGTLW